MTIDTRVIDSILCRQDYTHDLDDETTELYEYPSCDN